MRNHLTGAGTVAKDYSASGATHHGPASDETHSPSSNEPIGLQTMASPARLEARVKIASRNDIVTARQEGRAMAEELGFDGSETTLITAAISEVGRNILDYAHHGEIRLEAIKHGARRGIKIIACDDGPGIPNIPQAMRCGFSTRKRPGVGLPGAKWLMDEFDIESKVGKGTVITMKKWTENTTGENHWISDDS